VPTIVWRYCEACHGMFYDGEPDKGHCPAGGGHRAQGYYFVVPYNKPESAVGQIHWRVCHNCRGMFYDGYPDKGHCPAGGAHVADGPDILLNHDVPGTLTQQTDWRYCSTCHGLYYDGTPTRVTAPLAAATLGRGQGITPRRTHPTRAQGPASTEREARRRCTTPGVSESSKPPRPSNPSLVRCNPATR
jgi:hypothetical protein